MPRVNIEGFGTINFPDSMSPEEIKAAIQRDIVPKSKLNDGINPAEGMAGWEKFLAGAGKSMVDTGRGMGQLFGLVSREDVDAAKQRDAALMDTGAGITGNIAGQLAQLIGPSAALGAFGKLANAPRVLDVAKAVLMPQSIPGALAQGAAMGAIQPVGTRDSRIENIAEGGAASAVLPAAAALARAGGALVRPLTQGGRQKIAADALERFASNPASVASAPTQGFVPGSIPTLAESTQDMGLAQLQRTLMNNPDANKIISQRLADNTLARREALREIAGDESKKAFFTADRDAVAKEMYDNAFAANPDLTPWIKGQITQLKDRPAMRTAMAEAFDRAANEGIKLDPQNTVQVLHYAKMSLDDQASSLMRAGKEGEARAVLHTRDRLLSLMESKDFAPEYRSAREMYKTMSEPINQMDVGESMYKAFTPALADMGVNMQRANAAKFAEALREGDRTAARATGFPAAKIRDVMSPDQMRTLENIGKELAASTNALEAGKSVGSPTGQNLVSQSLLRSLTGPLGLPESLVTSTLAESALRPAGWALKRFEEKTLAELARAMVDPAQARALLAAAQQSPMMQDIIEPALRAGVPLSTALRLGLTQ